MAKKNKKPVDEEGKKNTDIDFSFQDVEREVDTILGTSDKKDKKKPEMHHISEKIQKGMEIKNELPEKGFLDVKVEEGEVRYKDHYGDTVTSKKVIVTSKDIKNVEYVEITDGLFTIDLRNDANWWFIRSPVVVPSMINQAVRVAVDIKECYKIKKRKIEMPIWLIAALIGGAALIIIMLVSLFG